MNNFPNFEVISLILNRFFVKDFSLSDLTVFEYQYLFKENPEIGQEQRAIARICYNIGVLGVRLGNRIITKEQIPLRKLVTDNWELKLIKERILNCENIQERKALETLERKNLEQKLKQQWDKTAIEKVADGSLIWWITGEKGTEKCGEGWEVHRGRKIDINISANGKLFLEIDLHHKFYTPWTLQNWLDKYPDAPVKYVRNNYPDKNHKYVNWLYEDIREGNPEELVLEGLDISLAQYHRQIGAEETQIKSSQIVALKRINGWNNQLTYHLSSRLSPSLTMEMLAHVAENSQGKDKQEAQEVFNYIRKSLNIRIQEAQKTSQAIINTVYNLGENKQFSKAIEIKGLKLPKGVYLAKKGPVEKVSQVIKKGCARVGELKIGCLNLYNDSHRYPSEVEKCLLEVAQNSGVEIDYHSFRTSKDLPPQKLDRKMFWQRWASQGIKTILVVTPRLTTEKKMQLRVEALEAGIATQFMIPLPKANNFKAINVVLGLLCKAGWQTVHLKPLDYPQWADLIIGFDTGTNKRLYYGTSAFAVLADGQSLGWELPDVQRGERISGEGIWQTISKLILKYHQMCDRLPKRVLLMRDGFVQDQEFEQTIKGLEEKAIAVDIISVRKSGTGRMGCIEEKTLSYKDASPGSVFLMPNSQSFLLVTHESVNKTIGSVRPLKVVHEYGDASLLILALQTYHLARLHPASGFSSSRLPWVLHLADRSSKEFQRIGNIGILQNLSREKLIAV